MCAHGSLEILARNICGIIVGETLSAEEAGELAEIMKNCPYLVASGQLRT
jgi:hypothetical protein